MEPIAQCTPVFVSFFECARHIVHVRSRSEKHVLFQPDALFTANEIAVGATDVSIVKPRRCLWQIRAESFLAEHRLLIQRKSVATGAWYALGLQSAKHSRA